MQIVLLGQEFGDSGTPGWNLLTGSGDRYFDRPIVFQAPLSSVPLIQLNLAAVDADSQPNLRIELLAANVTTNGFTLRVHTWADTKLYRVRANWFAVTP
jgi:hypothetical protein